MKKITTLTIALAIILFTSCKSKEEKEQDLLQTYITENKITTEPTSSGLYYIETKAGTGAKAKSGDKVKIHYTGTLIDGERFDSSAGKDPIEYTHGIGQVIKGWDEGIALMKVGGKAKLIIPSSLAYGTRGKSTIPGYSTLLFDVELVDVIPQ